MNSFLPYTYHMITVYLIALIAILVVVTAQLARQLYGIVQFIGTASWLWLYILQSCTYYNHNFVQYKYYLFPIKNIAHEIKRCMACSRHGKVQEVVNATVTLNSHLDINFVFQKFITNLALYRKVLGYQVHQKETFWNIIHPNYQPHQILLKSV